MHPLIILTNHCIIIIKITIFAYNASTMIKDRINKSKINGTTGLEITKIQNIQIKIKLIIKQYSLLK